MGKACRLARQAWGTGHPRVSICTHAIMAIKMAAACGPYLGLKVVPIRTGLSRTQLNRNLLCDPARCSPE